MNWVMQYCIQLQFLILPSELNLISKLDIYSINHIQIPQILFKSRYVTLSRCSYCLCLEVAQYNYRHRGPETLQSSNYQFEIDDLSCLNLGVKLNNCHDIVNVLDFISNR